MNLDLQKKSKLDEEEIKKLQDEVLIFIYIFLGLFIEKGKFVFVGEAKD